MAIVVIGNSEYAKHSFQGVKIDYDYPHGLDFSPNGRLHNDIVGRLQRICDDAFGALSVRHPYWNKVDEMMTVFIPLSEREKMVKGRHSPDSHNEMHRHTKPVSIVVPYSYATHETLMTYMTQAFLNAPIFQYDPKGPEDTLKALLLQTVVDSQVNKFKAALQLHTVFSDSFKYGIGMSTFDWREHWGKREVTDEVMLFDEQQQFLGNRQEKHKEDVLLFEGSQILPIDPYRYMPDPNVSIHMLQDAEFQGWSSLVSYYKKLEDERENLDVFNVRYIGQDENLRQYTSRYTPDLSHREYKWGGAGQGIKTNHTNYLTDVNMFITIIPKEWGLPGDEYMNKNGEYPEKWLFTLTCDTILTRATRHNLNHNMYPIAAAAPDFDGYSPAPIGRMEMLHGLQDGMNWLYNSHITNVRKAINDMLIVDPSLVVMKDLEDPQPGKLIRLRRSSWGRGVDNAVKQLQVNDVTKTNIGDSMYIMDIMQRVSAAVDAVQGIVRSGGERRSATEYRMTVNNAMSRLEHIAKVISSQYLQDISYMMASHTQQFMSEPVYSKLTADWQKQLQDIYGQQGTWISPKDIEVDFDVNIRDGSVPTTGIANADLMVQLFQIVAQDPELRQTFDITRMYARIAEILGDRNAFDFIRKGGQVQAATVPDEEVATQAQKGNLIPIDQAM